jgi:succinyl-diaminopimelate desuccinylase
MEPSHAIIESQLIQLTRDLVLIESTDSMPKERKRCFQFLRNHLDQIEGIQIRMYECGGYESLVAMPSRVQKPDVLFCAHLDVVEHSDSEYYQSRHVDNRIYGPGAGDMKGALAILLVLFQNILAEDPDRSVGLAVTSDEEKGGQNGVRFLLDDIGLRAGSVIIPDGGSIDEVTIEEKGILHAKATISGESAHAARPWLGKNPLNTLAQGLKKLEERFDGFATHFNDTDNGVHSDHWYSTCCVTGIETHNHSINRIPDLAEASFDIRFTAPDTAEHMMEILEDCLGEDACINPIVTASPTRLEPDQEFLKATESVLGRKPSLARVAGGSDARFFRQHGIPVMLSRPIVGNLHGPDEWIDIESMVQYYRICEAYLNHG